MTAFSTAQTNYLQGFAIGSDVARTVRGLPVLAGSGSGGSAAVRLGPAVAAPNPLRPALEAQDRALAAGKKLVPEEQAKRDKDPLAMWDEMLANAAAGNFPKGTDVLLYKFSGLFYVRTGTECLYVPASAAGWRGTGVSVAGAGGPGRAVRRWLRRCDNPREPTTTRDSGEARAGCVNELG